MKQRIHGLHAVGRLWMIFPWRLGAMPRHRRRTHQARVSGLAVRRSVRTIERKRSESLIEISCSGGSTWVMSRAGSWWAQGLLWMDGVFGTMRRVGTH